MKKTFAVVLAAMMMITAFAGCAKKTDKPATSPVVSEETTTSPEAPAEATASPEAPEAPVTSETPVASDVTTAAVSATPAA